MTELSDVVKLVSERLNATPPTLIGITGAVAVGKTTIADALGEALGAVVVSTDAFLLSNAMLAERDLLMRKGFPESYDADAIMATLKALKLKEPVELSVYSHDVYDVVAGRSNRVMPTDVVVVEGVVALQAPIVDHLDLKIYIDADASAVREWFIDRFVRFTSAARTKPDSFYHRFADFSSDELRSIAELTWDGINAVNLAEHIEPSREHADIVISKAPDHSISDLSWT